MTCYPSLRIGLVSSHYLSGTHRIVRCEFMLGQTFPEFRLGDEPDASVRMVDGGFAAYCTHCPQTPYFVHCNPHLRTSPQPYFFFKKCHSRLCRKFLFSLLAILDLDTIPFSSRDWVAGVASRGESNAGMPFPA